MNRIKKGDQVTVIAGKDKGRTGTVLQVLANDRVVVEGINVVKKTEKPNPQLGRTGGISEKEMSIHVSNVMLFDSATGKGSRVGVKTMEDGKKVRVFKSTNEVVDV